MSGSETVLIAGCGDLGRRVAALLLRQGTRVIGLRRRAAELPAGGQSMAVEPLAWDLAAAVPVLPPVDRVVFCAAPDDATADAYRAVYETAFGNLLRALRPHRRALKRLLLVTSTRCYAKADGGWVDEDSPVEARDAQTASLLAAEACLHGSGLPGVVLRPAGLYGAGEGPLLRSLRAGRAVCPPGPPQWTNRLHRDDAARAIVYLLRLPAARPVYLGVDCQPIDRAALLRELAEWIGVPPPAVSDATPAGPNRRCSNARLRASGFDFLYPTWRDGYRAVLGQGN